MDGLCTRAMEGELMLIDGRLVPVDATLRADVVVVGAGPAGITCAEQLASTGLHLLLVESAGQTHARVDDDALSGESSGIPLPLVHSRHRGFGGTSTHWTPSTGLRIRPLDQIDFVARLGRPNDAWPFGRTDLDPYYERAHQVIGVQPGYAPERWFGRPDPTPLAWVDGPQLAMFQFAPHDCFVNRFERVHAAANVDLLLHATVSSLETSDDCSSIERVQIVCRDGTRFSAMGTTFVLACGGIDNARVLLASPGRDGRGVGNEHDNVGRYFMDHVSVDTGVLVPTADQRLDATVFREFRSDGSRSQAMLWLGEERIARAGLPSAAFWIEEVDPLYVSKGVRAARSLRAALRARPRQRIPTHAAEALRRAPDLARFAMRRTRRRSSRLLAMRVMIEQRPDRHSRITLSDRCDKLGMRRVDVDWRVSDADLDAIAEHQELLGRLLEARGVATLSERFDRRSHTSPIMSSYHHLGTTRMHVDPRHGVVDPDGRVHSTGNLYLVGSSVFTAGGCLNPTLTIIALALKTADAIGVRHQPVRLQRAKSVSSGAGPGHSGRS